MLSRKSAPTLWQADCQTIRVTTPHNRDIYIIGQNRQSDFGRCCPLIT